MSTLAEADKLIETISSENDLMTKVKLLNQLTKLDGIKLKDVAAKLDFKPSYICHLLRLIRLPEAIIDGYYSNTISLSHLFIISRLKNISQMLEAYEKVLAESMTVKKTEELVRDVLYGIKSQGEYISPQEKENIIGKISEVKKNLKLNIIQTRIKSKIILEIKGDLESTSQEVRNFLKNFQVWQKIGLK